MPFIYSMLRARLVFDQAKIHEKYGDIVRIAPDEISFANEEAWTDIYTFRRGHKRATKDPAVFVGNDA